MPQRLEKLIKVCRDHGIEPVLITQPTLYGPGVDPVTGVNLAAVKLGEDLNGGLMFQAVELYNGVTRQVARQHGVLLIDLARELPRNSAYYYDYLHYTEPGAAAVAGIVERGICRPFWRPAIPPSRNSRFLYRVEITAKVLSLVILRERSDRRISYSRGNTRSFTSFRMTEEWVLQEVQVLGDGGQGWGSRGQSG